MNHLNSTSLPEPIARYIESANRFDAPAATECFTPDAIVRDEQKEHAGRAAIERWITQTSQAFQPQVTVASVVSVGAKVNLIGTVAGNFSGSPVNLDYEFLLQDGKIALLAIR
ncbi:nuclear transport factor 2 family protein [Horticoccus sp. 23ND18S-11]|uniref:nuclear transport factor 2 family protein n=1 Tax=Horticoccus sp. 23ND18S-11 TaxID=3391832 RepID=UPI0039C996FF